MSKLRKENRLNLRFYSAEVIDALEIHAAQFGLKLTEWARSQLLRNLFIQKLNQLLFVRAVESTFITQKLLEQLCTPEQTQKAKAQAKSHMKELEDHVRSKSE